MIVSYTLEVRHLNYFVKRQLCSDFFDIYFDVSSLIGCYLKSKKNMFKPWIWICVLWILDIDPPKKYK